MQLKNILLFIVVSTALINALPTSLVSAEDAREIEARGGISVLDNTNVELKDILDDLDIGILNRH